MLEFEDEILSVEKKFVPLHRNPKHSGALLGSNFVRNRIASIKRMKGDHPRMVAFCIFMRKCSTCQEKPKMENRLRFSLYLKEFLDELLLHVFRQPVMASETSLQFGEMSIDDVCRIRHSMACQRLKYK